MTPSHAGLDLLSTAVLLLDESLHVTHANPAAETLLAQGRKHLVGARLDRALPGNEPLVQRVRQVLETDAGLRDSELVLDLGGEPARLHCVITPVVEGNERRVVVELQELEQQLRIAREEKILEQQEANRELIRNLAHEIKNPAGRHPRGRAAARGRAGRPGPARVHAGDHEGGRPPAVAHEPAAHPAAALPRVEPINIHEVMERVRSLLLAEFPSGLEVRRDYDTSLPELPADKEQLIQAVLNIARNAAQALPERARRDPVPHPGGAPDHASPACATASRWR